MRAAVFRPSVLLALLAAVLRVLTATAQECGNMIKSITFEGESRVEQTVPYVEDLAYVDWAPYTYLDGFYGDLNSRGTTNKRAVLQRNPDNSLNLEVLLPEGCVTSECAMQVKTRLSIDVDSATLKFRMKFGPNFDWVRGGKLPGFCGAGCMTGCKEVTGLDGWSSRQMWRPCVWPPESPLNSINCSGGKLVAYVYHMLKDHWCGDDFEYANSIWEREYTTPKTPVVMKDFFQPSPDEWYTVWSHVQMNSAGPPGEPPRWKTDGKLQTWLQGPGFGPLLVVDKQQMAWRQYTNVSIDTLYFSVFFGGSSPSFQAKKDETIQFDNFQIWKGRCAPEDEPFSTTFENPVPVWPTLKSDLETPRVLQTTLIFDKAFTGGGCGNVRVLNTSPRTCTTFRTEFNVRPDWGTVLQRNGDWSFAGVTVLDHDPAVGWWLLETENGMGEVPAGIYNARTGFCVASYDQGKYLPENLPGYVIAVSTCVAGEAMDQVGTSRPVDELNSTTTVQVPEPAPIPSPPPPNKVNAPAPLAPGELPSANTSDFQCACGKLPLFPDNTCVADPDVDPPCRAITCGACGEIVVSDGTCRVDDVAIQECASPPPPVAEVPMEGPINSCATPDFEVAAANFAWSSRFCLDLSLTYAGTGACYRFGFQVTFDPSFFNVELGATVSRAEIVDVSQGGTVTVASPLWYNTDTVGQLPGTTHGMQLCGQYAAGVVDPDVDALVAATSGKIAECLACSS